MNFVFNLAYIFNYILSNKYTGKYISCAEIYCFIYTIWFVISEMLSFISEISGTEKASNTRSFFLFIKAVCPETIGFKVFKKLEPGFADLT